VKKLPNPADIIKLVFDCVLLLFGQPVLPVKPFKLTMAKQEIDYFESSFKPYGLSCMSDPNFLKNVITFGQQGKDKISEETIEFLLPYMELEHFNPQVRATAAQRLCNGFSTAL
jgi:dynein heavy chain, axonemal